MEGSGTALDGIVTAVTTMGSDVATAVLDMITALLPVFGPVVAAIIVVFLGWRLVKRFGKG